jgi:hypothetical protein
MRLVWVVIPLILFGIVGIQDVDARCLPDEQCTGPPIPLITESFAEQASGKPAWETNSDKVCGDKLCSEVKKPLFFGEKLNQGDYFSYRLCHLENDECTYSQLDFWVEQETTYDSKPVWIVQSVVYDDDIVVKGDIKLDKILLEPLQYSYSLGSYLESFQMALSDSSKFELIEHLKELPENPFLDIQEYPVVPPFDIPRMPNMRIVDLQGHSIASVDVNTQILVTVDLAYLEYNEQTFVWLIQIQDATDGTVVYLSWIEGIIHAGQSLSPSTSWMPTESGSYVVTAFLWTELDAAIPISPPVSTSVNVNFSKTILDDKVNVKIYTDKSEYKQGEEINITMKNEGTEDVFFKNEHLGFTIFDETGRQLKYFGTGSLYLEVKGNSKFAPLETMNGTWNQRNSYSLKSLYAPPGTYTITANFIDV